jgi:hypothetical protein
MARPRGSGGRSAYDKYRKFQRNWSGRTRAANGRFTKTNGRKTYSKFDKPATNRFTRKR